MTVAQKVAMGQIVGADGNRCLGDNRGAHPGSTLGVVMIASPQSPRMTPEEYLAWEEKQDIRYEYEHGEIIAMAGGTIPHRNVIFDKPD
jgi:hypothetical protein